jgi:hypothetical protein
MDYIKKYSPVFLSHEDESRFETELEATIPTIRFIEGSLWEALTPPWKSLLSQCQNRTVYLWDPAACPELPFKPLGDGRARGPTSGVVIQFSRSVRQDNTLLSGDLAIGFERANIAMSQFVEAVWKTLRAMNCCELRGFDQTAGSVLDRRIRDYIVGHGAKKLSESGVILKHCAANVCYQVERRCEKRG